jgi:integrase
MPAPAPEPPPALPVPSPASLASHALAAAADYARHAQSAATRRAYRADWADFCTWCRGAGWIPLPAAPETIAAYLASLATTHSRSTLHRRLAAIGQAHRLAGHEWIPSHPAIRNTLRGIARRHGSATRRAAALTTTEIRKLVATCAHDRAGERDRALLLLGFAGALRRSELVGIDREHLTLKADGLRLLLPRSKGDPEGEGVEIGIPKGKHPETCPLRALEAWLSASDCQYGPVFRKVDLWGNIEPHRLHPDAVRQILLRRARLAGLTVPPGERLSPHGLRAGFVTEAYMAGARDEQIMEHTRHKDVKTMRGYVRRAKLVSDSPARLLDL